MDQRRHFRRHKPVDRLPASDAVADVPRRDGHGLDVEELHPLRAGEPAENLVEPLAREAGTRVDTDARALDHPFRILPGEEICELVCADEEERIVPASFLQQVDGALVGIELDLVVGECGLREFQTRLGAELDFLVPWTHGDEDRELVEIEVPPGCFGECDVSVVRRVEGAAEQSRHWTSRTSPSTSTSSPFRAPAAFSAAASSSSSSGTSPEIRKPLSVRRILKRRPLERGRYTRKETGPSW